MKGSSWEMKKASWGWTPKFAHNVELFGRSVAVPRHLFNLITGSMCTAGCCKCWAPHGVWIVAVPAFFMCITTVIYHSSHCASPSWARWAKHTFMKYDIAAVGATITCLVLQARAGHERNVVLGVSLGSMAIWANTLVGWPLNGVPFNPILSLLHIAGFWTHVWLAAHIFPDVDYGIGV